ncbi:HesA/MoeB/ThiF family protein [Parabacteroides pacaensis]|uniref:HesA/MoeB/ThiF family protein n=1 Tax=Parabacteroides pacaensis TaxID=2086575 RepID=UPI000D10317D|nr:HesA/MoeB/ThiF family protein [Parabacteroides pacaensis]
MRYDRQITLPEIGEAGQHKLQKASVLIVGVGGLGSPISLYLAGAGVGTIGLVDSDIVSLSNLQRQVLYSEKELGRPKVLCAKERLEALNSEVVVHAYPVCLTAENATGLIAPYDIVVDGCDNFATRYLINDTCVALGKPYVYGAISELEGQVSVFNHTPEDPVTNRTYRDLYPSEEELAPLASSPKGVVGVTPGLVGCAEANEVLKLICGYGEVLAGKLWSIDLRTMQVCLIDF